MSADECYCAVEPWPGGAWPDPCDYCTRKAKERDARPDDMAVLRAQLADAMKIVDAALWLLASRGTNNQDEHWDNLSDLVIAYNRKRCAH